MPGQYLDRFFDDLEAKVAQYAAADRKVNRIGTIDREVRQGADWDRVLSGSLSTDRAFVAIWTPLYFTRENCGKELYAFVLRSRSIGIDVNGALTDVENVIPIRWLAEEAYCANTQKDSLIPPILRRINDTPAADPGDPDQIAAIQRYRKKGMERCVLTEPYYQDLLNLFALRIRDLIELPEATDISFATVCDAFAHDWRQHFATKGRTPVASASLPGAPVEQVQPRALASVVAFYITNRAFTPDPNTVSFADQLIAEMLPGKTGSADPLLTALLTDVRTAGFAEGLTVFHAAANTVGPTSAGQLLDRLTALSKARVLATLIIDPDIWPGTNADPWATQIEQIIRSSDWVGPVLLPSFGANDVKLEELVASRGLPPRLVALPQASEARIGMLRHTFVDARGRVLRASTHHASDAESLPLLKGVGGERI